MSTPTQDTAPQIALDYLKAVLEGYEGFSQIQTNPAWQAVSIGVYDNFSLLHENSAILAYLDGPSRISQACADKLHATTWRIHHNTLSLAKTGKITAKQLEEIEAMQTYVAEAFTTTFGISRDNDLDANTVIATANQKAKKALVPEQQ